MLSVYEVKQTTCSAAKNSVAMFGRNYNFKAKNRAETSSWIFSPKEGVASSSNPLQEEERKQEVVRNVGGGGGGAGLGKARSKIISNVSFDPLSDPLSQDAGQPDSGLTSVKTAGKKKVTDEYQADWKRFRRDILTNHSSGSSTNLPAITVRPGENSARHLTVQEFMADLETNQSEMVSRWKGDDRVEALKIIIQALKSLADTTSVRFYPAKFFLVLDMLAAFVDLVEARLVALEPDDAHEVAKNWLYKISSIREMVPRFFLETAFTRFDEFYSDFKDDSTWERLSQTIRGMGNPMLAIYSRMFLSRAFTLSSGLDQETLKNHQDEINIVLNSLRREKPKTFEKITFEDYIAILKPGLSWNTFLVTRVTSDPSVLAMMKDLSYPSQECSALMLECFLLHISGDFTSANTGFLLEKSQLAASPDILAGLGRAVLRCPSGLERKEEMISSCWAALTGLPSLHHYLACAAVWLEFAASHFQPREINKLLGLVIKRINKDRKEEENIPAHFNDHLRDILTKVVRRRAPRVTPVLRMQNFFPLFSLITREEVKAVTAKEILEELVSEDIEPSEERLVHDVLLSLSSVLAGSVSALTSRDETRQVSALIVNAVVRCSLLPDINKHLSFLTTLRTIFSHLDLVEAALVRQVNTVAATLGELSDRSVRQGLAAFSFITIPSIRDWRTRMLLYLETAQVCMMNSCLGQAEGCCRALNSLILEGEV